MQFFKSLEYFEERTLRWAKDRQLLRNSTPQVQMLKLVSEMGELADNVAKGRDVRDDIGDCLVVLTIIANQMGTDLNECFKVAYEDIKDRKGYMNEHGIFIKEGDTGVH
jgi:NTP pyrophosphatase (non-canonical NTP hydrolase)